MPDTIATAYADDAVLQGLLEAKIEKIGLDIPTPTWFLNLRMATKNLGIPSVNDAVLHALALYVRKVNEVRALKKSIEAPTPAESDTAQEETQTSNSQALEEAEKRLEEAERRLVAAEARAQIWQQQAAALTQMNVETEQRLNQVNDVFKKTLTSLVEKLEALEAELKKALKDNNQAGVKKLLEAISKTTSGVAAVEAARVQQLELDLEIAQAKLASLQEQHTQCTKSLAEAQSGISTTNDKRLEALEEEVGILNQDLELLTAKNNSLEEANNQLTAKNMALEKSYTELRTEYAKIKSVMEGAVARSRQRANATPTASTGATASRKRAALEEVEGSDRKRAKGEASSQESVDMEISDEE